MQWTVKHAERVVLQRDIIVELRNRYLKLTTLTPSSRRAVKIVIKNLDRGMSKLMTGNEPKKLPYTEVNIEILRKLGTDNYLFKLIRREVVRLQINK